MANKIEKVTPPAIPAPSLEYSAPVVTQRDSVFRLFFNRLTQSLLSLLSSTQGGRFLYNPRGLFYSTTNQTAAASGTGYAVEFENTYISGGVSVASDSQITVNYDGMYNFEVTLQVEQNNASACQVFVWINKNGADVPYGAHETTVSGSSLQTVHWNFSIDLEAGQYIEMYWATDDTGLNLHTEAATSPHPGIPSAVVAVSYVSNM